MKVFDDMQTGNCFKKFEDTDKVKEKMGGCGQRWGFLGSWS